MLRARSALPALLLLIGLIGTTLAPPPAAALQATPDSAGADPTVGPEPLAEEQTRADEALRARLQALFDRIGALENVDVEVEAGIVRLGGTALSLDARNDAVSLARQMDGVVYVEDRMRVVTDLRERLEPALERVREYALGAVAYLPLLAVSGLVLIGAGLLGGLAARWDGGPHLRWTRNPFLRELLRHGVRLAFLLAGLLVVLELLDATTLVGAVVGTAGVFGLALGFAFKDIVENHLAGVLMSLRRPFDPHDHVLVSGHEGKVVRLTARETILMTLAGNHVRIPNAEVFRSVMTNYSRNPRRRFDFDVTVGPGEDLIRAQDVGRETLSAMGGTLDEPPPAARVHGLGDSWVTLRFFGWVDQTSTDFGRARSEAIRLVKEALDDAGVSMPSPEYGVVVRDAEEAPTAADATSSREPSPRAPATPRSVEERDVSVDRSVDEQISEDRRLSDEGDLLANDEEPE